LLPKPQSLFANTETLNQFYTRRTNVGAASAFHAIHQSRLDSVIKVFRFQTVVYDNWRKAARAPADTAAAANARAFLLRDCLFFGH
jgi:hypothetical protein